MRRDLCPHGSDITSPVSDPAVADLVTRQVTHEMTGHQTTSTPHGRSTHTNMTGGGLTPMQIDTSTRRVRHEVADGVRLMLFSLGSSIALAVLIACGLGLL